MPVITACSLVQHRTVVPHDQHSGLPCVAVLECLAALILVELDEQRQRLSVAHSFKADDIAETAE